MAIRKTARGFQIDVYDTEGNRRKQTIRGITRREAEQRERDILARRDRGEPLPDPRQVPTFATFADQWLEESRGAWKKATLMQYRSALRAHLKPAFGDRRISALTEADVKQLVTDLRDEELSPRHINLVVGLLGEILGAAQRRGFARENPVAGLKRLNVAPSTVDPFTPEEIAAFMDACPAWWRPWFVMAFYTGMRPNELAGLKWADIDWERASVRIQRGRYRGTEGAPKTPRSVRDVALLPPVVEALRLQKAQQARAGHATDAYVFTSVEGACVEPATLRMRYWYEILQKAELRRRTMYETRHTFASNALAAGEPLTWVAKQLGHGSLRMLADTYGRWMPNGHDGSAFAARMARGTVVPV